MVPVISIALGLSVAGGVVVLVKRMLQRHEPTPEEIDQARKMTSPGMHLPTATTEMTQPAVRDPQFEADAMTVRNRQGF